MTGTYHKEETEVGEVLDEYELKHKWKKENSEILIDGVIYKTDAVRKQERDTETETLALLLFAGEGETGNGSNAMQA